MAEVLPLNLGCLADVIAADGVAKAVLGSMRSANAILFGQRILGNRVVAYTMADIVGTTLLF